MNIQIRENKLNRVSDKEKSVEISLSDIGDYDSLVTAIGFETISSPTGSEDVLHSGDSIGDKYLVYGGNNNPIMNLILPEEGLYNIKIVAQNTITSNGEITTTNLNANGDLITTTSIGPVPVISYIKSGVIALEYDTADNVWS